MDRFSPPSSRSARAGAAVFCLALLLSGTLATARQDPRTATPAERPRILVTNDDGWQAPGIAALVAELARFGEVVLSAPAENQSGASQSVGTLGQPMRVRPVAVAGAAEAWAVEGTPAVAAAFGILQLGRERPFDLVVSGINRGANVGDVGHISGTIGAAMQAAALGLPAIASSQDSLAEDYAVAAAYTARVAQEALAHELPVGVVLSINVPAKAAAGGARARALPMGKSYLELTGFSELQQDGKSGGALFRPSIRLLRAGDAQASGDTAAYLQGEITVTPLAFDWTAHDRIEWLGGWLPQP